MGRSPGGAGRNRMSGRQKPDANRHSDGRDLSGDAVAALSNSAAATQGQDRDAPCAASSSPLLSLSLRHDRPGISLGGSQAAERYAARGDTAEDPQVELYVLYVEVARREWRSSIFADLSRPARLFRPDARISSVATGILLSLPRRAERLGEADIEAARQHLHAGSSSAPCRSISGSASSPIAREDRYIELS